MIFKVLIYAAVTCLLLGWSEQLPHLGYSDCLTIMAVLGMAASIGDDD